MKREKIILLLFLVFTVLMYSQSITERNYNTSGGVTTSYDTAGMILYPTGYSNYSSKTPVIFVHGIFGKLSGSYEANIAQVKNYHLKAAFVQLDPIGSTVSNGKLLKKMIDRVRMHYNVKTVSIVAHSKGGMDTERALYGQNPYVSYNHPSFGFSKVDAVYTFSSPVKGARVADLGATLSWFSGTIWATMWYTNGWSLTSGNVNSFHNWARGWRVNGSVKNYYNPSGTWYSRINMKEDNSTRWWAHQSNDECYKTSEGSNAAEWLYCYVGRPFQHSIGAYYDAYWEWDWFDSGWRNWHSNSDGFISEYRAKRTVNTNPYPRLTPGAGDANYRTTRDANHTSLWEKNELHFTREVAPYLHYGSYGGYYKGDVKGNNSSNRKEKDEVEAAVSRILASSGNIYAGKGGKADFIVEEDHNPLDFIIYSQDKIENFKLTNTKTGEEFTIDIEGFNKDELSGATVSVANTTELKKGTYTLNIIENEFLVIANNSKTSTAFAVNLNFDEEKGYNGETIEVAIANKDNAIDFDKVKVTATIAMVGIDSNTPISKGKVSSTTYDVKPTGKEGFYGVSFEELSPGSVYSLRIEAISKEGEVLISRNIVNSFYVKQDIEVQSVTALKDKEVIDEIALNTVNVYPNPTSELITISNQKTIQNVILLNDTGDVLKTFNVKANNFTINVKEQHIAKGLYLLKIELDNETVIKKLMVN